MKLRPRITASLTAVTAATILSACASTSHAPPPATATPRISAATACHDFTTWAYQFTVTNHGQNPMAGYATLHKAAAEAPSGPLYEGMSSLDLAVANPPAGVSLVNPVPGTAPNNYLLVLDNTVAQIAGLCSAVNPAG